MATRTIAFIGTHVPKPDMDGLFAVELDRSTGAMKVLSSVGGMRNPIFHVLSPDEEYLYVACDTPGPDGKLRGAVASFRIDPATCALTKINEQPAHGKVPCHMSIDATGKMLLVANYSSGNVATYPLGDDGAIGIAGTVVNHEGSGPRKNRQDRAYAHSITVDPGNQFAFACDLGADMVFAYKLRPTEGTMAVHAAGNIATPAGAGPRHMAFHPNGKHAYVITELDNTVLVYNYDSTKGVLKQTQVISTLPGDFKDTSYCADLHCSPDGKYLYGSNRGHDSLAIYAIDQSKGTLTPVGFEPTGGKFPRGFNIDPTGEVVLAANQNSDSVFSFHVNASTGLLNRTGHELKLPTPVCVQFATM